MSGKIEPYKSAYTHRVLPLVYDDALSHIETLGRFTYKLNEVINMVNGITDSIIADVNAYTDQKVAETFAKIDEAVEEVYGLKGLLDKQYTEFRELTNAQLILFNNKLTLMEQRLNDIIIANNQYTDLAIEQNNERIFKEMGKSLSKIKVINYFTGASITVQEMFDYLCLLHVDDSLNYDTLVGKNLTYTTLASLNINYTDLVLHGNLLTA